MAVNDERIAGIAVLEVELRVQRLLRADAPAHEPVHAPVHEPRASARTAPQCTTSVVVAPAVASPPMVAPIEQLVRGGAPIHVMEAPVVELAEAKHHEQIAPAVSARDELPRVVAAKLVGPQRCHAVAASPLQRGCEHILRLIDAPPPRAQKAGEKRRLGGLNPSTPPRNFDAPELHALTKARFGQRTR
eukprot:2418906-Prymnesium_polylepis.2